MIVSTLSRRRVLKAGAFTLVGAAGLMRSVFAKTDKNLIAEERSNMTKEQQRILRTYWSGWEKKDWTLIDGVLADSFTFTSPNNDDHISKPAFKERCWGQAELIERFDLESVARMGDEVFVKYLCHTTKGTSF